MNTQDKEKLQEILQAGGKIFLSKNDYEQWKAVSIENDSWSEVQKVLMCDRLGGIQDGKPVAAVAPDISSFPPYDGSSCRFTA